jgi:hypothetical protein
VNTQDIIAAREELASKTRAQIEAETADKWAARAVAAYERYATTSSLADYADATIYWHEALEHASEAPAGTVEALKRQMTAALNTIAR